MDIWNLLNIRKPIWLCVYDYIGQSNIIGKINYCLSKLSWNKNSASSTYQTLAQETNYQHQVSTDNNADIAYVHNGYIYVNENYLSYQSYGVKRWAIFHESIHIKNNDLLMVPIAITIIHNIIMIIVYYTGYLSTTNLLIVYFAHSMSVILSILFFQYYCLDFIETRAEIEASEAVQCYRCVEDYLNIVYRNTIIEGYLGRNELYLIRDYYKTHNLLCKYHKT